ncbi:MAG TPA: TIGR01777 family oxidoreductase [Solirubrobacteraceae bacterium]|nr:TIGR01777 family oxidoreductase [Solirubrobacteraceae bacterium]
MSVARATVTGASGLIGRRLLAALKAAGADVTALTRDPSRAGPLLGGARAVQWDPLAGPAPAQALEGADVVFNLAGETIAQRWSERARRAIRESRAVGTANLVGGIERAGARPPVLVSSSAIGYYGAHGDEPLDEETPPGTGFLAGVCVEWEQAARGAERHGVRVTLVRTGVVLDAAGGALAEMLPPFRLGLGGPIAGGHQYISWVHVDDVVGLMLAAAQEERWAGAVNATAPDPVTNGTFAKRLAARLHRPALVPVPALALRARYGEMASLLTTGARVLPARALVLGYRFAQPDLDGALAAALPA